MVEVIVVNVVVVVVTIIIFVIIGLVVVVKVVVVVFIEKFLNVFVSSSLTNKEYSQTDVVKVEQLLISIDHPFLLQGSSFALQPIDTKQSSE